MINPKLLSLTVEETQKLKEDFELDEYRAIRHNAIVHFKNEFYFAPKSYLQADDPEYVPPTAEEISEVIESLAKHTSKTRISRMLGLKVNRDPTRTINRWAKGEATIPYAAWRMLLILDGRVCQFTRTGDEETGGKLYELDGANRQTLLSMRKEYIEKIMGVKLDTDEKLDNQE